MKPITLINTITGIEEIAQPFVQRRGGWANHYLLYFVRSNGSRITPYEFGLRWKYKHTGEAMGLIFSLMYDDNFMRHLVYAENPFLAMIPKDSSFGGKYIPIPLSYGEDS